MFKKIFSSDKKLSEETSSETLKSLRITILGYIGYSELKDRKSTDQAIRKYWYEAVLKLLNSYSEVQNRLMQGQLLSTWPASNAIIAMLNELRTLLANDVYRHSTFFETADVSDSLDLDVIHVLESETILILRDIDTDIGKLNEKLAQLELLDIERDVFKIKSQIEEVKSIISDRAELIASFELVGI